LCADSVSWRTQLNQDRGSAKLPMIDIIVRKGIIPTIMSLLLMGCGLLPQPDSPSPTLTPISGAWATVGNGIEQRTYIPDGNVLAQMITLRIDPQRVRFQVHYRPGDPLTLQAWRNTLVDADVIINANFFLADHTITGMLVADGIVYGQSFTDRGGTFGILDGIPVLRSNIHQPYAGEPYTQAIQAFPMLVRDGQASYFDSRATERSRRSVVGLDQQGNVILMATPGLGLSLNDLSAYLPTTDLNLQQTINLDGGGSTMLYVRGNNTLLPSFDPVPAVLAVYMLDTD